MTMPLAYTGVILVTPVIALLPEHLSNGEPLQPEARAGTAAILSGLLLP